MKKFSWAAAPVAALLLMSAPPALADTQTLSVVGNGTVFITPDVADLSVSVTKTAAHSRQALSAANRETDAIVAVLRGLGIAAGDIQTQNVNVYSFRNRHHVRRWSADESLGVHITAIKLVGQVIDGATRVGASAVSGPNYSFSDPSAGMIAAARAAIADARRRADDAAAAVGYQVTGVQSLNLDPESVVAPTTAASSSSPPKRTSSSTPTTVNPGTEEVDAQVAVVYTIAPG